MSKVERRTEIRSMHESGKSYEEIYKYLTKSGTGSILAGEKVYLLNLIWEKARSNGEKNTPWELLASLEILDYHWADRFCVYSDPMGQAIYLKLDLERQEVRQVSLRVLIQEAVEIFGGSCFDCIERTMAERVERWGLGAKPQIKKMPSSFALKGETGLTFNRIDIDVAKQNTPMFDQICNRIEENAEAMKAFLWSVFERDAAVDQYLWLTGDGEDGKGSLMRLFEKLLGDAHIGLDADNKRWPADCVGKRLGVFNDIVRTAFPMKSAIKQVTGADRVTVERKYKDAVSLYLDTKFVFTTNKPLNTTGQKADVRRCIYVKFGKNTDGRTEDFEQRLWEERAGILFKCREAYRELADKGGSIKCDYNHMMNDVQDFEMPFESIFERHFELSPDSCVFAHRVFEQVGQDLKFNNRRYGDFKEWLKRVHGVREAKRTIGEGKRKKVLVGIRLLSGDPPSEGDGKLMNLVALL